MTLRLDGRVAIITGAGVGLGREHALLFAKQGAKVVVNDVGSVTSGEGGDTSVADALVEEIRSAGGTAVANHDSVATWEGASRIVDTAIDNYGRLDILVNNAGILRDKTFSKVEMSDFDAVMQVHFWGTVYCTKAAWSHMVNQKYGRVVFTSSSSGHGGNFGQSNYGSAKSAMLGLMNCLAIEGRKNNILVNSISPAGKTRMTETMGLSEGALKLMDPAQVSPAVAWLASERCDVTAYIITASSGGFSRVHYFETKGVQFDPASRVTVEMFDRAFGELADLSTAKPWGLGVEGREGERLAAFQSGEDRH